MASFFVAASTQRVGPPRRSVRRVKRLELVVTYGQRRRPLPVVELRGAAYPFTLFEHLEKAQ
jgi:hypothetical protein